MYRTEREERKVMKGKGTRKGIIREGKVEKREGRN